MNPIIAEAVDVALVGGDIGRETARGLVHAPLSELLEGARILREGFFGRKVDLCAIANARSGRCGEDCAFCAQSSRHSTNIAEYPMISSGEIVERAKKAAGMGARRFGIVTSGGMLSSSDFAIVCDAIRKIRGATALEPCASLGRIDRERAEILKGAGLSRYHHNLECSERFFGSICSTHSWRERLETVRACIEVGLESCSGGIFGMGEKWEDRIDLAMTLREAGVHSVPLNFLMPVEGTPLRGRTTPAPEESLRIVALFRFILPQVKIMVAGGREAAFEKRQGEIFEAGASGMMVGDYLTLKGRKPEDDLRMIRDLGLEIA